MGASTVRTYSASSAARNFTEAAPGTRARLTCQLDFSSRAGTPRK
ncbi:MAG TPA: hypothetical protein VFI16_05850 [Anaeromyxobacteraceae bacterium]|nr:hypothetical protein [Anaeromyxobacteraceae bacterium]